MAKAGASAFSECLHNDVGELHKSAVSLSRLSIRNYVLDLNPNSLLFLFCSCTQLQRRASKMHFLLPENSCFDR